jgi:subtilisin family serine protease
MRQASGRALGCCGHAALLFLLAACAGLPTGLVPEATRVTGVPKQLQARQVIVTLPDSSREQWPDLTRALAAQHKLSEAGNFPLESIRVQCVVFQVPPDRPLESVLRELEADRRVESVQLNQVFEGVRGSHSDPYAALEYGAAAIHADAAHRISTGRGARVAVVDTGVDRNHPDLRGRVIKASNFVEGGESSFTRDRHGTAVAGVIGARADDGIGIFGIAPEAELSVFKACWYPHAGDSKALCSSWTLAKAVDAAIGAEVRLLNLSLSGPADALLSRLLLKADASGITIVAAAAQDAGAPGFPASLAPVIAVIASDVKGSVQVPSWVLDKFVMVAPGIDILTTAPNGGYDFVSGSSMAAAHVTGVAALLLAQKPELTPAQIAELLQLSAQPTLSAAAATGSPLGIVDACAALARTLARQSCGKG